MLDFYVNSTTGIDEEDAGTISKPFRTLDYCITNMDRSYNDNVTIHLDKGEYDFSNSNLYYGVAGKSITILGTGIDTIFKNKFNGNNSSFGTTGFSVIFARFIWDNSNINYNATNPQLFYGITYLKNILFKNFHNASYGYWYGNTNSPFFIENCVDYSYSVVFLRDDGNESRITNSYGKFDNSYSDKPNLSIGNNKIVASQSDLQLDEDYYITDPTVDTSKIGLYAGEYAWANQECLIKMNNKYYSINEEFWNTETKTFNEVGSKNFEKSFVLSNLTKEITYGTDTFIPLDKFYDFKVVFKDERVKKLNLNAYKIENKIVITNPIDVRMIEKFNSITINGNNVKCLFKFDTEDKFFKYDFEQSIIQEENISNISTTGIDITQISNIDFNKIQEEKEFKSILFAFYLEQDSIVNSIIINYIEIGEFEVKDAYYTRLKIGYKKLSIQPNFSADIVKINVI